MVNTPTILLAISHHGFGHLAQLAAILREWRKHQTIKLVVYSAIPRTLIDQFLLDSDVQLEHIPLPIDLAMEMVDAVTVDRERSFAEYAQHDRNKSIKEIKQHIVRIQPDLIIGNVPPLAMRAGRESGIPTILIGSLDWAGVFSSYCGEMAGATEIIDQLNADYACADAMITLTPGTGFPGVIEANPDCRPKRFSVGPIARQITLSDEKKAEIRERCGGDQAQLILVSMGGMPVQVPYENWPHQTDRKYLIAGESPDRNDMISLDQIAYDYLEVLNCADIFISKIGYGAMVEAACAAVPTLYLPRGDWPEEPISIPWYQANMQCQEIDQHTILSGEFDQVIETLLAKPHKPAVKPTGAAQAVEILRKLF